MNTQGLEVLSVALGEHKYILDTAPTQYDLDSYSLLAFCFLDYVTPPLPRIATAKKNYPCDRQEELPNLVNRTERIKLILYPELAKQVQGEYLIEAAS